MPVATEVRSLLEMSGSVWRDRRLHEATRPPHRGFDGAAPCSDLLSDAARALPHLLAALGVRRTDVAFARNGPPTGPVGGGGDRR